MTLRDLRKHAGMTQQDVGEKVGVCAQMISHYEIGRSVPSIIMATQLANLYGVTLSELATAIEETKGEK